MNPRYSCSLASTTLRPFTAFQHQIPRPKHRQSPPPPLLLFQLGHRYSSSPSHLSKGKTETESPPKAMNIEPSKREWLCIIPDKPDRLAKRLEIRPTHLANLKPLLEANRIAFGGPMFQQAHPVDGQPPQFKGSTMVLRAATEAEVREILTKDIYATSDVWDLENMQIIPVMNVF